MEKKTQIAVLFGGKSSEHDISCLSAKTIVKALDRERYDVYCVFLDRRGRWYSWEQDMDQFSEEAAARGPHAALLPGDENKALLQIGDRQQEIDVVIPVFHGLNGEDGTIQGYLEIVGVPYVGCGVRASACAMDKLTTKLIVDALGIRQARYVSIAGLQMREKEAIMDRAERELGYPMFVKPSNAGSSIGVSCAENREELAAAIALAAENDNRILIEEKIVGREIECAVLGNLEPEASGVGEILAADTFYTFDAKYSNAESRTVIDPELPGHTAEEVRRCARAIFAAMDCRGLSRVDFFVEQGTNAVIFNEINTFPGFTSISMYPMLWAARGIELPALMDRLIRLAQTR